GLIKDEIARLLSIYGINDSFNKYAGSLLQLIELREKSNGIFVAAIPPNVPRGELTIIHRVSLGNFALNGVPLPAEWAFAWCVGEPTTYIRTPDRRCPNEFREAFVL